MGRQIGYKPGTWQAITAVDIAEIPAARSAERASGRACTSTPHQPGAGGATEPPAGPIAWGLGAAALMKNLISTKCGGIFWLELKASDNSVWQMSLYGSVSGTGNSAWHIAGLDDGNLYWHL